MVAGFAPCVPVAGVILSRGVEFEYEGVVKPRLRRIREVLLTLPSYVLVTPARNEAQFIELTLKSVVAQTLRPLKWVIVSDGSTDDTDGIVNKYAARHDWIELLRQPERADRNFAGKAAAFRAGCSQLVGLNYQVIGNLDADISFDEDYFAFLMSKFAENPMLGVGGTPYAEEGKTDGRLLDLDHVSGACQMFRRGCFEAIGGYSSIKSGGIDLISVLSARSAGWQTRTYPEKICHHHRKMGSAQVTGLSERWHRGRMDYLLGSHPAWEAFRSLYQMRNKPFVIGGILILCGYLAQWLRGVERTMPVHLVTLRRQDQMQKLKNIFRRALPFVSRAGERAHPTN
jgi:poly-beta-1,6-N-acetyl-D-glucosamine synthase